jgi:hypothetical protein
MSLYPTIEISAFGMHEIPSGNLAVVPLTLLPSGVLTIQIAHLGPPAIQDHSLRAWVSLAKGGAGLSITVPNVTVWHPNRTPDEIVHVVDQAFTKDPPRGPLQVLAPPGPLWLNILNLVNLNNPLALRVETVP